MIVNFKIRLKHIYDNIIYNNFAIFSAIKVYFFMAADPKKKAMPHTSFASWKPYIAYIYTYIHYISIYVLCFEIQTSLCNISLFLYLQVRKRKRRRAAMFPLRRYRSRSTKSRSSSKHSNMKILMKLTT